MRVAGLHQGMAVLFAVIAAQCAAGAALADCPEGQFKQVAITSVTPAPTIANYDPFTAGDATATLSITIASKANQPCTAAITFARTPTSAQMSSGGSTLNYVIEPDGGGNPLITTGYVAGSSPAPANRLGVIVPANGSSTANIRVRIPAGQVVAAGGYHDNLVQLLLVALDNSNNPSDSKLGPMFSPQATVVAKCSMPPPAQSLLDLTSAISNGRANGGVKRSTSFSNVACTAPSKLRLTGAALQPTISTPSRSGFDNFINFRAQGTFGNASSTLITTTSSQSSDSSQKNVASGATTGGQILIDVNLATGQPILAGSYSGTLTVSIDPSF